MMSILKAASQRRRKPVRGWERFHSTEPLELPFLSGGPAQTGASPPELLFAPPFIEHDLYPSVQTPCREGQCTLRRQKADKNTWEGVE